MWLPHLWKSELALDPASEVSLDQLPSLVAPSPSWSSAARPEEKGSEEVEILKM